VFSRSSRGRLTPRDRGRFTSNGVFDRIALAVCDAGCLPRKELFEAWEVARRARRLFRGGRVIDLGSGHGLLGQIMLILDDSSPSAIAIDKSQPACAVRVHQALVEVWPRLDGRIAFLEGDLESVQIAPDDIVVSSHACGRLSDVVIDRAASAGARLALMPCCHDFAACDTGSLTGWLDPSLAVDVARVVRLESRGYRVWTQSIPPEITPKNRLLLAARLQS
jgi:SAM-dependent methyltransferase